MWLENDPDCAAVVTIRMLKNHFFRRPNICSNSESLVALKLQKNTGARLKRIPNPELSNPDRRSRFGISKSRGIWTLLGSTPNPYVEKKRKLAYTSAQSFNI
jgi:hypothetical protein